MNAKERDRRRLEHMLEAAENILCFIEEGQRDIKTQAALERMIEIIGEAANHVSEDTKSRYPDVPWKNITGMRNILVHEYYKVKEETVWDIAEHKIPALKDWVAGMLKTYESKD